MPWYGTCATAGVALRQNIYTCSPGKRRSRHSSTATAVHPWQTSPGGNQSPCYRTIISAMRGNNFTDDEIWDIGAITSLFALSNRYANFAGIRPNDEFFSMAR